MVEYGGSSSSSSCARRTLFFALVVVTFFALLVFLVARLSGILRSELFGCQVSVGIIFEVCKLVRVLFAANRGAKVLVSECAR